MTWHDVGKEGDIDEGRSIIVNLDQKQIAVFKAAGNYYAIENVCPHRGGPLGEGHLEGTQVTCPWHAWTFDLATGQCLTIPSSKVSSFKVKVENGRLWVES